jgi:hypothetical protein
LREVSISGLNFARCITLLFLAGAVRVKNPWILLPHKLLRDQDFSDFSGQIPYLFSASLSRIILSSAG